MGKLEVVNREAENRISIAGEHISKNSAFPIYHLQRFSRLLKQDEMS